MLSHNPVSTQSTGKAGGPGRDIPRVLKVRIRNRAKTWMPVSYDPLLPEPHSGRLVVSSRLESSARSRSVGIEDQAWGSAQCKSRVS